VALRDWRRLWLRDYPRAQAAAVHVLWRECRNSHLQGVLIRENEGEKRLFEVFLI
jgi:hypothetical protein